MTNYEMRVTVEMRDRDKDETLVKHGGKFHIGGNLNYTNICDDIVKVVDETAGVVLRAARVLEVAP